MVKENNQVSITIHLLLEGEMCAISPGNLKEFGKSIEKLSKINQLAEDGCNDFQILGDSLEYTNKDGMGIVIPMP